MTCGRCPHCRRWRAVVWCAPKRGKRARVFRRHGTCPHPTYVDERTELREA